MSPTTAVPTRATGFRGNAIPPRCEHRECQRQGRERPKEPRQRACDRFRHGGKQDAQNDDGQATGVKVSRRALACVDCLSNLVDLLLIRLFKGGKALLAIQKRGSQLRKAILSLLDS